MLRILNNSPRKEYLKELTMILLIEEQNILLIALLIQYEIDRKIIK
jgi:hypothetical protein